MGIFTLNGSFSSHTWGMISGCKDCPAGAELWFHRMDRHNILQVLSFSLPFDLGHFFVPDLDLLLAF
jgi:hypothetical protein